MSRSFSFLYVCSLLFFVFVIFYSYSTDYSYYIFDAIFSIILLTFFFFFRSSLHLTPLSYFFLALAFAFHNMGAFRFYASPPVPFRWDIVTHVFGIFAASVALYLLLHPYFSRKPFAFFVVIILASLGVGVLIEYVEFIGVLTVGAGEGVLGRGEGDFAFAQWLSADYYDTIIDQINNLIGALLGYLFSSFYFRKQRLS